MMPSTFVLEGITSEGETFEFPGVRFSTAGEAYRYAQEYARGVSGTDTMLDYPPEGDFNGYVRAVGENYSERVSVREIEGGTR